MHQLFTGITVHVHVPFAFTNKLHDIDDITVMWYPFIVGDLSLHHIVYSSCTLALTGIIVA